jgi:hypothetical protein
MGGYVPTLTPYPAQKSQCATSWAAKAYRRVGKQQEDDKSEWKKVEKRRKRELLDFENKKLPRNHGIDHHWKTRKDPRIGCVWRGQFMHGKSRHICDKNAFQGAVWREFGDTGKYYYSLGEQPTKPELMQRFEAAKRKLPDRFHCEVEDVRARKSERVLIWCAGLKSVAAQIRISGEGSLPRIAVGDVVSVPLAKGNPPDPLIEKALEGPGRRAEFRWTVSSKLSDLKVEKHTDCAIVSEAIKAAEEQAAVEPVGATANQ